jgi:hypothetical protein
VERPEPERLRHDGLEAPGQRALGQPEGATVGDDEEILVLNEQPVALGLRSAAAALGRLEGRA